MKVKKPNLSSDETDTCMPQPNLMVTLWPSFPHFQRFASDTRLSGIRLNSAMITAPMLEEELDLLSSMEVEVPLYFDIKGRQLRVVESHENDSFVDITLNHAIQLDVDPQDVEVGVLFKAGSDKALLARIEEDGKRLIFEPGARYGPEFKVKSGESLSIRHPYRILDPIFTEVEMEKISMVREAGFKNYFLSYVESEDDVTQFRELVGEDSLIMLKIESKAGLEYVAHEYQYQPNVRLVAARGDLYVEVDKPHDMLAALQLIIEKDPEACVASRIFLSVVKSPVPECHDFLELAWLYDIGYRTMMLCDEICLKEELLSCAVNAFESFRNTYHGR